jgi:hypothetical protein
MTPPLVLSLLGVLVGSAIGCVRVLPQSSNLGEARLSREELNVAVRVTKKGFCFGVVAVFHEDPGARPSEESCRNVTTGAERGGDAELASLAQFLSEIRKRKGSAVRVVVTSEPEVGQGELRRFMEAVKTAKGGEAGSEGLRDFVVSEGASTR